MYKYRLLLTAFSTQRRVHILDSAVVLVSVIDITFFLIPHFPLDWGKGGNPRSISAVSRWNLCSTTWLSFQEHPAQASKCFWCIWAPPFLPWWEYSVQLDPRSHPNLPPSAAWDTVSPLLPKAPLCGSISAATLLSKCGGGEGKETRNDKSTWDRCWKSLGIHCYTLEMCWQGTWGMWAPAECGWAECSV